jgi:archaellum component FlaG (FlaF/FlaG flagellin family)
LTEDAAPAIRIPGWAVSIIVLLISQILIIGFAAGKVTQHVDLIDKRLDRIEDHIFGR